MMSQIIKMHDVKHLTLSVFIISVKSDADETEVRQVIKVPGVFSLHKDHILCSEHHYDVRGQLSSDSMRRDFLNSKYRSNSSSAW